MKKTIILTTFLILLTAIMTSAYMTPTINTANNTNSTTRTPTLSFTPVTNETAITTCDFNFDGSVMFGDIVMTGGTNVSHSVTILSQDDGSYNYNVNCSSESSTGTSSNYNINIETYPENYVASDLATISIDTIGSIFVAFVGFATLIGLGLVYSWAKKKF